MSIGLPFFIYTYGLFGYCWEQVELYNVNDNIIKAN